MHVTGQAISIILPHNIQWYDTTGRGLSKLNKDIYDELSQLLQADWKKFDLWSITRKGEFVWEKDKLADMIYITFRQWDSFLFSDLNAWGFATLGASQGAANNIYTVFQNTTDTVRILSSDDVDSLGSGLRIHADMGPNSKQRFIDLATHEHGHYLFGWGHNIYSKMSYGGGYGSWEFSLNPWELIKLKYIVPKIPNYNYSSNYLYDYSSRGQNGSDTNEVIQVPISGDGGEFFLIANRRKISDWDRRVGGDTLADDRWQFFKNINPEYGKGLFIYHIKDAYETNEPNIYGNGNDNDIDLECADGLWNWDSAGISRQRINSLQYSAVIKKNHPYYNNDNPDSNFQTGKDEMSKNIIFSPGSQDNFSTNPIGRGTHSIYTNENDYWYSLASNGDRWDAWNVGYNVIFSPYSSPNTKDMLNNQTGIFIYYKSQNSSSNEAQLEIFRAGYGGKTENQILEITPPSKPMGLRVLECDSSPVINDFKRIKLRWNHNMEPDMSRPGESRSVKRYNIYRTLTENMETVPDEAMFYPEIYYDLIDSIDIDENDIPEYIDSVLVSACNANFCSPPDCWIKYPVRYRVQAVDKYLDESVLSEFAKAEAWNTNPGAGNEGGDNITQSSTSNDIPDKYELKQNYPNPFNPSTNIQFDLPEDNFVTIKIYDILGKEVYTLVNDFKQAGRYSVSFEGSMLSSGVYFYKFVANGNVIDTKRFVILK